MMFQVISLADCERRIRDLEDRLLRTFAPVDQSPLRDQLADLRFHRDRLIKAGGDVRTRPT